MKCAHHIHFSKHPTYGYFTMVGLRKPGPCGRAREWARLGVDPLSWLLSNNRLEEVHSNFKCTSPNCLLLSNQDKGSTPSLAHSLALPLGPGLLNQSLMSFNTCIYFFNTQKKKKKTQAYVNKQIQTSQHNVFDVGSHIQKCHQEWTKNASSEVLEF